MAYSLLAGAGRAVITPPVGAMLLGYAPARPALVVHDDLTATAIALASGDTRVLLVSATVGVYDNDRLPALRRQVAEACGVPEDNVLLCATHTHSGPMVATLPGWSDIDVDYWDTIFAPGIVKAARQAAQGMRPVRMGVGTAASDVGINRRRLDRHGNVHLGQCSWGCFDPLMTVISLRADDGIVANLIHYNAHATASGINDEVTRDWPGPMTDRLEARTGAVTAFFNGAIGDTGPRLPNGNTTGDVNMAQELGARAGIDAVHAFDTIRDWRDAELTALTGTVLLPYAPPPTPAQAHARLAELGDPAALTGMDRAEQHRWACIADIYKNGGEPPAHFEQHQTVVALGPVAFVPFAHEMFVQIALRLRDDSPYQHTLCLSNCNGSYAYFPSRDQHCRGGYEVDAMTLVSLWKLAPEADDAAVDRNLALQERMHG